MNKTELPETIRAFVAIYPEPDVVSGLRKAQEHLREMLPSTPVRWTAPEQLHLTLAFLGDIASSRLEQFQEALAPIARTQTSFRLHAASMGVFPHERRPSIVWAGLSGEVDLLGRLKQTTDAALQALGFIPEDRPFRPHLTLGRVRGIRPRDALKLSGATERMRDFVFGDWQVERLQFMRSELRRDGASHSSLFSVRFIERPRE